MKRLHASDIVLKVLGLLLLTAAVLKGHELLTVPTANKDLWSWRPFVIFQVECEVALGVWLLWGVAKPLAWLAGVLCFGVFCCVAVYKGLADAASCGCFGAVHVNPWVTLCAIDLPAVVALMVFPAKGLPRFGSISQSVKMGWRTANRRYLFPIITVSALLLILPVVFVSYTPASMTETYVLFEPEKAVGSRMPSIDQIDIATAVEHGKWRLVFYRHNCVKCSAARDGIVDPNRSRSADRDRRIALIEIPPLVLDSQASWTRAYDLVGHLSVDRRWYMRSPCTVDLDEGVVVAVDGKSTPPSPPLIAITQKAINLGRMDPYAVKAGSFDVKNIAGDAVDVQIRSSCACTKPTVKACRLSPGQSTRIPFLFYARAAVRSIGKEVQEPIFVTASDTAGKDGHVLMVTATPEPLYEIRPSEIDFGDVSSEGQSCRRVCVRSLQGHDLRQGSLQAKIAVHADALTVSKAEYSEEGTSAFIDVNCLSGTVRGPVADAVILSFRTPANAREVLLLPVQGVVWDHGIKVIPSKLDLAAGSHEGAIPIRMRLESLDGEPFSVHSVNDDVLDVSLGNADGRAANVQQVLDLEIQRKRALEGEGPVFSKATIMIQKGGDESVPINVDIVSR